MNRPRPVPPRRTNPINNAFHRPPSSSRAETPTESHRTMTRRPPRTLSGTPSRRINARVVGGSRTAPTMGSPHAAGALAVRHIASDPGTPASLSPAMHPVGAVREPPTTRPAAAHQPNNRRLPPTAVVIAPGNTHRIALDDDQQTTANVVRNTLAPHKRTGRGRFTNRPYGGLLDSRCLRPTSTGCRKCTLGLTLTLPHSGSRGHRNPVAIWIHLA